MQEHSKQVIDTHFTPPVYMYVNIEREGDRYMYVQKLEREGRRV